MAEAFHVETFLIGEYATSASDGKSVLAGVFGAEIRFAERPVFWPQFYLYATIKPKQSVASLKVRFLSPEGVVAYELTSEYKFSRPPEETETINLIMQTPPVPFAAEGRYSFEIIDGETDKPVLQRAFVARIGALPTRVAPEITLVFSVRPQIGKRPSDAPKT